MTARTSPAASTSDEAEPVPTEHLNEVHVVGRLAAEPDTRVLPSGDTITIWRLIVERGGDPVTGRPSLDTLECVAWTARLRRSVGAWSPGDLVEVRGSLRRRFWRNGVAVNSRYEIEALQARRLRRGFG